VSPSLDTVGLYARTVPDVALLGRALIGFPALDFDSKLPVAPRIGVYRTPDWPLAEAQTMSAFERCAGSLARAGAKIVEVAAPSGMDEIISAAEAINTYETYRSLAYERMHHAHRLSAAMTGKLKKAERVTRSRYVAALETANRCAGFIDDIFRECDVLITPSATGEAPAGLGAIGPASGLSAFQAIWTTLHTPAISIPVFTGRKGLPIGLQVIGARRDDEHALLLAHWMHHALT
jgi:amidase